MNFQLRCFSCGTPLLQYLEEYQMLKEKSSNSKIDVDAEIYLQDWLKGDERDPIKRYREECDRQRGGPSKFLSEKGLYKYCCRMPFVGYIDIKLIK